MDMPWGRGFLAGIVAARGYAVTVGIIEIRLVVGLDGDVRDRNEEGRKRRRPHAGWARVRHLLVRRIRWVGRVVYVVADETRLWVRASRRRQAGALVLLAVLVLVVCLGPVASCQAARTAADQESRSQEEQSGDGQAQEAPDRTWGYPASLDPQTVRALNDLGNSDSQVAAVLDNQGTYARIGAGTESSEVKLLKLLAWEPAARTYVEHLPERYPQDQPEPYDEPVTLGTVPTLYQWDERWAYTQYTGMQFGASGCCPTALSMVYMALTGKNDMTPYAMGQLAVQQGYASDDSGTYGDFVAAFASQFGLEFQEIGTGQEDLVSYLGQGYLAVASMGSGDFTDTAHYIVVTGVDADGKLTIHDPYSKVHTDQAWDPQTIAGQAQRIHVFKLPA